MRLIKSSKISVIKLRYDSDLGYWIYIDDVDVRELFSYDERVEVYLSALEKLITDMRILYKEDRGKCLNEYLWLITAKNHRPDGLVDVILLYYISELISLFIPQNKRFVVKSDVNLEPFFVEFLKGKYGDLVEIKNHYQYIVQNKLRLILHPLKRIKSIRHLICFGSISVIKNSVFLQSSSDYKQMRYRGYDDKLVGEACYIFPKDLFHSVKNIHENQFLVKLNLWCTLKVFIKSFRAAIRVQVGMNRLGGTLLARSLQTQYFPQTFFVVFRQLLTEELIQLYKPREVIVVQTIGDPQSRYLTNAVSKFGIKTKVFSCRPMVSNMRPEDIILPHEIDSQGNPLYGLGDAIVVLDKFSLKSLVKMGYPEWRIEKFDTGLRSKVTKKRLKKGFLFLFNGENYSVPLLRLLENVNLDLGKFNIYVKNHPLLSFTAEEQRLFGTIFSNSYTDLSNFGMHELDLSEVVCFTTFSTSGVEAVQRGAGLVWLPFTTERMIQFAEVMKVIGQIVKEPGDLSMLIEKMHDDSEFDALIEMCSDQYNKGFSFND